MTLSSITHNKTRNRPKKTLPPTQCKALMSVKITNDQKIMVFFVFQVERISPRIAYNE
jgi:hypothetical protein